MTLLDSVHGHFVQPIELGNPAACRGHKTDGVSPVESRSITPQGEEAVALPFGRPRG